jgi:hypothetical protein
VRSCEEVVGQPEVPRRSEVWAGVHNRGRKMPQSVIPLAGWKWNGSSDQAQSLCSSSMTSLQVRWAAHCRKPSASGLTAGSQPRPFNFTISRQFRRSAATCLPVSAMFISGPICQVRRQSLSRVSSHASLGLPLFFPSTERRERSAALSPLGAIDQGAASEGIAPAIGTFAWSNLVDCRPASGTACYGARVVCGVVERRQYHWHHHRSG